MPGHRFTKLEELEDRHPGFCRQVEAMLRALIPLRAIGAALQAQYGECVGPANLREYRWECRNVWRAEGRRSVHRAIGSLEIGSSDHRAIDSLKSRPSSVATDLEQRTRWDEPIRQ
jgi:hypothetical protein